jgi:hypothetical protein
MLGDAAAAVKTALRTVIPTAALGANAADQELALMQLAAVWSPRAVRHSAGSHGRRPQQGSRNGSRRSC